MKQMKKKRKKFFYKIEIKPKREIFAFYVITFEPIKVYRPVQHLKMTVWTCVLLAKKRPFISRKFWLTVSTYFTYLIYTVNSRFNKDLNLQIHLHKTFFPDDQFLESVKKIFLKIKQLSI